MLFGKPWGIGYLGIGCRLLLTLNQKESSTRFYLILTQNITGPFTRPGASSSWWPLKEWFLAYCAILILLMSFLYEFIVPKYISMYHEMMNVDTLYSTDPIIIAWMLHYKHVHYFIILLAVALCSGLVYRCVQGHKSLRLAMVPFFIGAAVVTGFVFVVIVDRFILYDPPVESLYVIVLLFLCGVVLYRLRNVSNWIACGSIDDLTLWIPFIGDLVGRHRRLELARCMILCLSFGKDIIEAAQWTKSATKSPWLRRKLQIFISAAESGQPWNQAWGLMNIDTLLERWIIQNGALIECPIQGFMTVGEHLHAQISATARSMNRWAPVLSTLLLGLFTGATIYILFSPLVALIHRLAEW